MLGPQNQRRVPLLLGFDEGERLVTQDQRRVPLLLGFDEGEQLVTQNQRRVPLLCREFGFRRGIAVGAR